jgi:hypothetical protein
MTSPAAAHLRASIAALPESERRPWVSSGRSVNVHGDEADWLARCDTSTYGGHDVARHIALTASPDVVALWADLLDALTALTTEAVAKAAADTFVAEIHALLAEAEELNAPPSAGELVAQHARRMAEAQHRVIAAHIAIARNALESAILRSAT